jgi:hypothetical protein
MTIDIHIDLSPRQKRLVRGAFIAGAMIGTLGIGVAAAAPKHTFVSGTKVSAADMNENFADLDARLAKVEVAQDVEAMSVANETGMVSTDYVYTAATITLTPGTWLVEAHATLYSTGNPDGKALGLFDATNNLDVPASKSGVAEAVGVNTAQSFATSKVITVTAPTVIRMKAYRNGGSILNFGYLNSGLVPAQRLLAVRLK